MRLQTRRSARESGHSLEFSGPLQTREHSLPVIRKKKRLWTDSAVNMNFTPFCCMITFMHMRCTEQVWSYSLEFCPGGYIKINREPACLCSYYFSSGQSVSVSCMSYVLFYVISLVISKNFLYMIFSFWMLSFKPAFSLSSFTSIKRLSSSLHFLP